MEGRFWFCTECNKAHRLERECFASHAACGEESVVHANWVRDDVGVSCSVRGTVACTKMQGDKIRYVPNPGLEPAPLNYRPGV